MKKVIRITEDDLVNIIGRVLNEGSKEIRVNDLTMSNDNIRKVSGDIEDKLNSWGINMKYIGGSAINGFLNMVADELEKNNDLMLSYITNNNPDSYSKKFMLIVERSFKDTVSNEIGWVKKKAIRMLTNKSDALELIKKRRISKLISVMIYNEVVFEQLKSLDIEYDFKSKVRQRFFGNDGLLFGDKLVNWVIQYIFD